MWISLGLLLLASGQYALCADYSPSSIRITKSNRDLFVRLRRGSPLYCYLNESVQVGKVARKLGNGRHIKVWHLTKNRAALRACRRKRGTKTSTPTPTPAETATPQPTQGTPLTATPTPTVAPLLPQALPQFVAVQVNTSKSLTLAGLSPSGGVLAFQVVIQPQHGSLSGQAPLLIYTPEHNYLGEDSFSFIVNDGAVDSNPALILLKISEWVAPLGIPEPPFGIHESYRMYDDPAKRNPALTYRQNAEGGYFTHYVDNTSPNATNLNNPFGTPEKPRMSIPVGPPYEDAQLSPGSVVEVHGGPYGATYPDGNIGISGAGSAAQPIFVRGVSAASRPVLAAGFNAFYGGAEYMIIEHLTATKGAGILGVFDNRSQHHVAVRDCDISGAESVVGSYNQSEVYDIVLYRNVFHDCGIWDPAIGVGDDDCHGIGFAAAHDVWILDNEIYHFSGNGSQIGNGHHIYFGRNFVHHNKQSGFGTKYTDDVIFSQNVIAHHTRSSSDPLGCGIGSQYGSENVWSIFNNIYDNGGGMCSGSDDLRSPQNQYYVGNVVHNIHRTDFAAGGFSLNAGSAVRHIVNNTIYDVDYGILNSYYPTKFDIRDNIIANVSLANIWFATEYGSSAVSHIFSGLLDPAKPITWDATYQTLAAFQAAAHECGDCLAGNPIFIDADNADFSLEEGSPGANLGTEDDVYQAFQDRYGLDIRYGIAKTWDPETDPDSFDIPSDKWVMVHRPQGSGWDIGAFEN